MKRLLALVLSLLLCLLCTACGSQQEAITSQSSVSEEEEIDAEQAKLESLAADYLVLFCNDAYDLPHSVEIYDVWVFCENDKYYFTVELSAENSYGGHVEQTRGNSNRYGLSEDQSTWRASPAYFLLNADYAMKNGEKVNAKNVQAYYDDRV